MHQLISQLLLVVYINEKCITQMTQREKILIKLEFRV